MKKQKVIITNTSDEINSWLELGWFIVHAIGLPNAGDRDQICFVIEKLEI